MSNELQVMNWFFGLSMGLWLVVLVTCVICAKVKRKKIGRVPLYLVFIVGCCGLLGCDNEFERRA
jgi:hypothetical protein